jgi:hypothetical protein
LTEICYEFKDVAACQKKLRDQKERIEKRIIEKRRIEKEKEIERNKRKNKLHTEKDYVDHRLLRIYYKIKNMEKHERKTILIDIVDFLNRKFAEQKDFENITPFMNDL